MIKYIGSKRALLPWLTSLVEFIQRYESIRTILDPFSGSGRVAHAFKARGFRVIASDYATYSYILAKALIENDAEVYPPARLQPLLDYLNSLPGDPGWFTEKYAEKARFFQPANAARIESIRKAIDEISAQDENLRAILLTSLLLAADKVDSTTGLQMAYLKRWAPRASQPLRLNYPPLLPGGGLAAQLEAPEAVRAYPVDLVYLDPPYNQHSYLANYHVWETLVRFDNPPTYGVVEKRADVRTRKSPFNSREAAPQALAQLMAAIQARVILLSFSNEGFFTEADLYTLCRKKGYVAVLRHPHRRYIGAQIGIYNPAGEKVGQVSHLHNEERLFVISPRKALVEAVEGAFLPVSPHGTLPKASGEPVAGESG